MESGYAIPDGKRFVEEAWSEINEPTTVPMSLAKRRRVNPSDVVEEPILSFAQAPVDSDQGRMASMDDTNFLLATSNSYSSTHGDSSNWYSPSMHNISPHSFLSIDNLVPMPGDFEYHPHGEFVPSYTPTVVNGDGNFQLEFC